MGLTQQAKAERATEILNQPSHKEHHKNMAKEAVNTGLVKGHKKLAETIGSRHDLQEHHQKVKEWHPNVKVATVQPTAPQKTAAQPAQQPAAPKAAAAQQQAPAQKTAAQPVQQPTPVQQPAAQPAQQPAAQPTAKKANTAPVAEDKTYTTKEDTILDVQYIEDNSWGVSRLTGRKYGVLDNAVDSDGDKMKAEIVTPLDPAMGTLRDTGKASDGTDVDFANKGTFVFEPTKDFNGKATFTYKLYDGTDYSDEKTVTIDVTPVNDAPVATDDTLNVTQASGELSLSVVASDVDGDQLTAKIVTKPSHGTVSFDKATGKFTYTPNSGYNGQDEFKFKAYDGTEYSNEATITINVSGQSATSSTSGTGSAASPAAGSTLTDAAKIESVVKGVFNSDRHNKLNKKAAEFKAKVDGSGGSKLDDATRKVEFEAFEKFVGTNKDKKAALGEVDKCFSKPDNYCVNNASGKDKVKEGQVIKYLDQILKPNSAQANAKTDWCAVKKMPEFANSTDIKADIKAVVDGFCNSATAHVDTCNVLQSSFDWAQFDTYSC